MALFINTEGHGWPNNTLPHKTGSTLRARKSRDHLEISLSCRLCWPTADIDFCVITVWSLANMQHVWKFYLTVLPSLFASEAPFYMLRRGDGQQRFDSQLTCRTEIMLSWIHALTACGHCGFGGWWRAGDKMAFIRMQPPASLLKPALRLHLNRILLHPVGLISN